MYEIKYTTIMTDNCRKHIQKMLFDIAAKSKNEVENYVLNENNIHISSTITLNEPIIIAYPMNGDCEFRCGFVLFKVVEITKETINKTVFAYNSRMYIPNNKNNVYLSWNVDSIYILENGKLHHHTLCYFDLDKIIILPKKAFYLYNKLEKYFLLNKKIIFEPS